MSGKKKESQYLLAMLIETHEFGANAPIAHVMNRGNTIDSVVTQRKRNSYFFIDLEWLAFHFYKAYSVPGNMVHPANEYL